MLSHLYIKDFAIIPSLALDFRGGFTAITGETGAGKSILVDALGLLLGDRSDSSWVRQGADKAELTAEFLLDENPAAGGWLTEVGLDADMQCLLRRSIAASGRSRAWINGTPVTLQQLSVLGNLLVEIHGQNEHVQLTRKKQQFGLLDGCGDYAKQLTSVAESFARWKTLQDEFDRLEQQSGVSPAELDYLKFQLRELEAHAVSPAEVTALEQEHRKLAQGGALMEALQLSITALDGEDSGGQKLIQSAIKQLEPYRKLDESIDQSARMLAEAAINCEEAVQAIRHAHERIDLSPERLDAVSSQLGTLADLGRKHGVPMEDLQQVRDDLTERLERSENFESHRAELEAQRAEALRQYRTRAEALSNARRKHADKLSRDVSNLMDSLGMPGGILDIHLRHEPDSPPSPGGDDAIELLVSANPGVEPGPLVKIASGGELSRISLAIKVAASSGRSVSTQIFDEVDAGIGGDTANTVGSLMRKLAQGSQALCVTHLAQVAVCADQQLQVRKQSTDSDTAVDTALLKDTERVDEIARMLSGRVSEQSRRHATEMLQTAVTNQDPVKDLL